MEAWDFDREAYERAKGGLQAALRTINRHMDKADAASEADQALKRTFESKLQAVDALFQRVLHFDEAAYAPGYALAVAIHSEYGGRRP